MEDAIVKATDALVGSLAGGDAATAASLYAANATLLTPAARLIRGRAGIEAYWHAGIALGLAALELRRELLEAIGEHVVEAGRYAVSLDVAERGRVVDRGAFLVLHAQMPDGSWRRAVEAFTPDEPAWSRRDERKEESR